MINLLNAGFERLRKSKLFWALSIFSIMLAMFMIYTRYSDMKKYEEVIEVYDEVHIPADTTAEIYWLNNRKSEQWRNKQDKNNNDSLAKLDKLLEEQKNA